jgi:cytochrome c2
VFRRLCPPALAALLFFVASRPSFASSPAQAGLPIAPDSPLLWLAAIVVVLVLVIVTGVVLSLLVVGITRFFTRNVPAADKMTEFNAKQNAALEQERTSPSRRIQISPTAEPFVIAIGGFLVVFAIASAVVVAPPPKSEASSGTQSAPAQAGLPTKGDFTQIVSELPTGNADSGAKLFTSQGCSGCHGLQKDQRIVGPSFHGLWGRAATRVPGMGAKEYLYQSIVDPNAHIVESFQSGLMPATFAKTLNAQQVSDLIAYIERDHNEK